MSLTEKIQKLKENLSYNEFDTSFLMHYFEKMYIFQSRQECAEVASLVFYGMENFINLLAC